MKQKKPTTPPPSLPYHQPLPARPSLPPLPPPRLTLTIGIDIGATNTRVALVDAKGSIQGVSTFQTAIHENPEAVLDAIIKTISDMRLQTKFQIAAIGAGVAGQVHNGVVASAPNIGWKDVALQLYLENALDMPVVVINDVRAAAWGEYAYGQGKKTDSFVCLFIGTGIGGAFFMHGRVMTGANNAGCELGHMVIDMHGPLCTCGNKGCLEAFAGGWALAKKAKMMIKDEEREESMILELAQGDPEMISAKHIMLAAKKGDRLANQLLQEFKSALVVGCANIVNIFNPALLVIGGGIGMAVPELAQTIEAGVRRQALKSAASGLQVIYATLGNDSGIIGAAAYAAHYYSIAN